MTGMYADAQMAMRGEMPQRFPFITRLEAWYKSHLRSGTLPEQYAGMSLDQVHQSVGVGRLKFSAPYALRLKGVEVHSTFNGEEHYRAYEPEIENFPGMWDVVPTDRAGVTRTELITPEGRLTLSHALLEQGVFTGTDPYLKEHLIKEEEDYHTVEIILEKAEFIPRFDRIVEQQRAIGADGFVVPLLHRIPFQQVLLEYLGEAQLFFELHDAPQRVQRLMQILNEQMEEILTRLAPLKVPYLEFPDNLHGLMTNPRLFAKYCLPAYQQYCEALHEQGKKAGSHTDGNIRPLLGLLKESGLDVCESFSPYPLTECRFEEAWEAFAQGPLLWGGIPSPILEENVSQDEFQSWMQSMFAILDRPMILGVVDLFMRHNSIERVKQVAQWAAQMEVA